MYPQAEYLTMEKYGQTHTTSCGKMPFKFLNQQQKNGSYPARATLQMVDSIGHLLNNGASVQETQVLILQTMQILE